MKTPAEIAHDILSPIISDNGTARALNQSLVYRWVERAIEADRAQREQEAGK